LLWIGDILFWYGACGLVVFLFRRLSPRWLIVLGLLSISIASLLSLAVGLSVDYWPPENLKSLIEDLKPSSEVLAAEVAAYQGGWLDQMSHRIPEAVEMQTFAFLFWGAWRVSGLMLLGMALFKLGVFSAERSRGFYATWIILAVTVGIPVAFLGIQRNFAAGWEAPGYFFIGSQYNYWGSLLVSLGWVGVVMLACKKQGFVNWLTPVAAIGRTAFSNYILQTVICTTIFYGHGLGLFGRVERVGQAAIVVAIWVFQLAVSSLWLKHFKFGPLEWLWRSLVYVSSQPMRRAKEIA
jgi:uncharacterized protein